MTESGKVPASLLSTEARPQQVAKSVTSNSSPVKHRNPTKQLEDTVSRDENQHFGENGLKDILIGRHFFKTCQAQLDSVSSDWPFELELSAKQRNQLRSYLIECGQENAIFGFYDQKKILRMAEFGNEFSMISDSYNSDFALIESELKKSDEQELIIAQRLYYGYFEKIIEPLVESRLNLKSNQITDFLVEKALYKKACESGLNCSAEGHIMMNHCYIDEMACGLTFNEYFDTFSSGIKSDISAALQVMSARFGWGN